MRVHSLLRIPALTAGWLFAYGVSWAQEGRGMPVEGVFARELQGSLIGSIFFGYEFKGFSVVDFVFIGFFVVVGVAIVRSLRQAEDDDGRVGPEEGSRPDQHAEAMWRHLEGGAKDKSAAAGKATVSPDANTPRGFEPDEFLKGSKMAYARIHEAWEERDMDDLRQFVTPRMYEEYELQAQANLAHTRSQIMLLEATLLDVEEKGDEVIASVDFSAMLKGEGSDENRNVRQIWTFIKPAGKDAMWKLDGIERVQ